MKKVLILCTGNSCRSQMAEAWGNHLRSNEAKFYSAGIKKHGMNPYAVQVMQEADIQMDDHYSKTTEDLNGQHFDLVITVCGHAHETCPVWPGSQVIHHGFDDPPRLTENTIDPEERLNVYRRVRDEIRSFMGTVSLGG